MFIVKNIGTFIRKGIIKTFGIDPDLLAILACVYILLLMSGRFLVNRYMENPVEAFLGTLIIVSFVWIYARIAD